MKKALITGITGQDGSYLADLLVQKGYEVHGIIRRASTFNTSRIDHLYADPHINGVRLFLHYGDLTDSVNLVKLLYDLKPDEIYNLAAQSHVKVSFEIPEYTADVTGTGTIRLLEAMRETGVRPRFYQASSVDRRNFLKGAAASAALAVTKPGAASAQQAPAPPRNGTAPILARPAPAPAVAAVDEAKTIDRPGSDFMVDVIKSLGFEYIFGVPANTYMSLQESIVNYGRNKDPEFILATNETHTVQEFCEAAFAHVDLDWKEFVKHDDRYERPAEVDLLIGDPAKAKKILGWEPKVRFKELVQIMVDADLENLKQPSAKEQLGRMP